MVQEELDVRLYERHEDGGFSVLFTYSARYFDNTIPSPGDTIVVGEGEFGTRPFRILRRHFITHGFFDRGWALFVEQLPEDHDLKEIARQWSEDTKFFNDPSDDSVEGEERPKEQNQFLVETVDDLDRTNRDPAYWTPERKELLRQEREARLAAMQDTKKK